MSNVLLENLEIEPDKKEAFAALLEKNLTRSLTPGHVVVGEIVALEKETLVVDIGGKCEGMVPYKEIPLYATQPHVSDHFKKGDVKDFYILREFDEEHSYLLSLRRVDMWKDWETLKQNHEENIMLDVQVCKVTRGGVLVQALSLKGFIPASQLRIAKTLDDLVGDVIPAKLLEVDRNKNKLILSHREAVFENQAEQRKKTLSTLEEGMEVEGEIVKITNFGAFVDINGIDGLLPLSEISWRRLSHPSDELNLGQKVTVQVLSIDRKLERISLSRKRLTPDPWHTVLDRFKEGDLVDGHVSKLLNSGFLAELEPGIEAFCGYNHTPKDQVYVGETFPFQIVSITAPERRITLEPPH